MLLAVEGYWVQAVGSLAGAVAVIQETGPLDLLVTGHTLANGEDGRRVIDALRKKQGSVLRVVLLGGDSLQSAGELQPTPDLRICRKPARADDLLRAIRELLEGRGEVVGAMVSIDEETVALFVHDLRSSLSVIANVLKTCRTEALSASLPNARKILERQIAKSLRMAEDLLAALRPGSALSAIARERVSLTRVIVEAAKDLEVEVQRREQSLTLELPPDELWINGDSLRLGRVMTNLLENASKYSGQGGRLRVSARRSEREVEVRILDDGIGIREEDLPHVFEPYFRSRSSRSGVEDGSGLGLALARRIVELHGGTIQAKSGGPGLGSEFTMRLAGLSESSSRMG
ncbi:MAG TPA: hybrid sensor histidine kinase/response regulator [Steroidobacteraceae bacterium]|nr:hybrid sensor histidine kinase/response regulator [Steroidobacteraceae bacterium]